MNALRPVLRAACALVLAGVVAGPGQAQAGAQDVLFGVRALPASQRTLVRIDTTTGLETWQSPGFSYLFFPLGLSNLGGRLLSYQNNYSQYDSWRQINPANAALMASASAGFDFIQGTLSYDVNPVDGVTYMVRTYELYAVNSVTGTIQLVGPVIGLPPGDALYALAIDSNGWAVGVSGPTMSGLRTFYSLDLQSGHASPIGQVQFAVGTHFIDMTVSSSGDLWSFCWVDSSSSYNGLYRVDLGTLSATLVRATSTYYFGLAFSPPAVVTTYCTAKTNSAQCPPWISSTGWASPTADTGFVVRGHDVLNQTVGMLLYTASCRAAYPFGGGTMCLGLPRRRTPLQSSGGSPTPYTDCSGAWSLDLNAFLWWNQPGLPAGTTLQCQWLGRDPGFAPPGNYQLSDALELTLNP